MMDNVIQFALLVMSAAAVWLLASKDERRQFVGCIVGVFGQPLWLWSTWSNGQWGMFILALVFSYSYGKGAIVRRPRKR